MAVISASFSFDCTDAWFFQLYLFGTMAIFSVALILEVALAIISGRGGMADTKSRTWVYPLLWMLFIAFLGESVMNVMGFYWVWGASTHCVVMRAELVTALKAIVISCWIHEGIVAMNILVLLWASNSVSLDHSDQSVAERLWRQRITRVFCCAGVTDSDAQVFDELGKIAGDMFKGIDVVTSDLAAAMVVLHRHDQQILDQENRSIDWSKQTLADKAVIADAAYFLQYPTANYGWMHYVFYNGVSGFCSLLCHETACQPRHNVRSDDSCASMEGNALHRLVEGSAEIIHANLANLLYKIPYFIAIDHAKRAVVVSLRGSMSMTDAILDVEAGAEPLSLRDPKTGMMVNGYGHSGMLKVARNLLRELEQEVHLQKIMEQQQGYTLMLCGHSMGAGSCALLALLLVEQYPTLKCIAYSPPGGLVSENLAELSKPFVVSILLDLDMVGRLSLENMAAFRNRLLHTIDTTAVPKCRLLCFPFCHCCVKDDEFALDNATESASLLSSTSYGSSALNLQSFGEKERLLTARELESSGEVIVSLTDSPSLPSSPSSSNRNKKVKMVPPGLFIHLVEDISAAPSAAPSLYADVVFSGKINEGRPKKYRAVVKKNGEVNDIRVHMRMMGDHMPVAIHDALLSSLV